MMEVLILIFWYQILSISLLLILCLIPRYYYTPFTNIGILHLDGLCELYRVINILDCENLTLTLYTKGKDGMVNRLTLALEVYKERKNPIYYLRPYFTNPKSLLDAMAESNVYILGFCTADYFMPGSTELYFNFDFYI